MPYEHPMWYVNAEEAKYLFPTGPQLIKRFWNPVDVYFGDGASKKLGKTIKDLNHNYVFLVADEFLFKNTNIVRNLRDDLRRYDIANDVYLDVKPEPKIEVAEDISDAIRNGNYDCVVGVGGGSVLDMAKVAAGMAKHKGKAESYLGSNKFTNSSLDMILIPTTSGTGSEVTNRAMVTADEKAVFADDRLYAKIALVDPRLILSLPPRITADTGFDALSHSIEGILSAESFDGVKDVEDDGYKAVGLIYQNIKKTVEAVKMVGGNAENEAEDHQLLLRENMMLASLLSGFVLSKKSMVYGHSMAYPFASRYKMPHGRSTAMALPYIMEFYLSDESSVKKISNMSKKMGIGHFWQSESLRAKLAVESIRDLIYGVYKDLDTPITLKDVGVAEDELPFMSRLCLEKWPRKTSPIQAEEEDILTIYKKMWKGSF